MASSLGSAEAEVAFSVLGPLAGVIDGVDVAPHAQKERALLAMLVINHGQVVSADRLMEELWPDLTADRARRVLRVRIAAVRKMATFDGPARAIRCAASIVRELCAAGIGARAGLHSGECELVGDEVGGVAVQIARGVADLARLGEVRVSQTVRDVVFGSAITFSDAGRERPKDVPGDWRVYTVTGT